MKYYILECNSAPKGESGESVRSRYSLDNACPKCGTNSVLIGPLFTKGLKSVKEDLFSTLDGDIIISEKLQSVLTEGNIKLDVSEVMDKNADLL